MARKNYTWEAGAKLELHTARKHKVLSEYFREYIFVRCRNPNVRRFRLAVVDGFAGAGRYDCGSPGSPLIFLEGLQQAVQEINLSRVAQAMPQLEVDCLLVFNDADKNAVQLLKGHVEPLLAAGRDTCPPLRLTVEYSEQKFEDAYPAIRDRIMKDGYQNVLFNLDQCGHSQVDPSTLVSIMNTAPSAEIFYTFVVTAMLAYLQKKNSAKLQQQLAVVGVTSIDSLQDVQGKNEWLGVAEKLIFDALQGYAKFVSPFSINNPNGWRYWLIHLAASPRARQVYNDILHSNASSQAHYGRSGLNMLSYDPTKEGALYLFEQEDRVRAKDALMEDIPRVIARSGDAMSVTEFYETIYNLTPAHNDDIHGAIIDNPDLEVLTETGGARRRAHTIHATDVIQLKPQRSIFPLLLPRRD